MAKKLAIVFMVVVFFLFSRFAFAGLIINEIMYAPQNGADYEWVELYNNDSREVNLTDYRFFHGETNSGPLTLKNGDTAILPAYKYAIIAKSLPSYSWLDFSGMVLSASTLSLPDSGTNTYIAISDESKNIIDHVTYDTSLGGSKDSGTSLQLIGGSWVGAESTPGTLNKTGGSSSNVSSSSSGTGGLAIDYLSSNTPIQNTTTSTTKNKITEEPKIKTQIIGKNFSFVGFPLSLQAVTYGYLGEKLFNGKYFWNFGDGDSKEIDAVNREPIVHNYFYPGDYVISLDYYQNRYSNVVDASNQITVKIIGADVVISSVGDEKDFFVELSNNSNYDADISNWILKSDKKSFTIPRNTILSPKKKIIISPKITNFSIEDKSTLKLLNPEGGVIFPLTSLEEAEKNNSLLVSSSSSKPQENKNQNKNFTQNKTDNLSALAVASDVTNSDGSGSSKNSKFIFVLSFVFIAICAGMVYFIRQKNRVASVGDDFEILDE